MKAKFIKMSVVILGLFLVSIITAWITHIHTKESYRQVGIQDGKIELGMNMLTTVESFSMLESCARLDPNWKRAELFVAKGDVIYLVLDGKEAARFCR